MSIVAKHSIKKTVPAFGFAIDPLEETIAYETLFSLKNVTETSLEKEFPSKNLLEKEILSNILELKRKNGRKKEIEENYPKVEELIKSKWGSFSVCTQGDFHFPVSLETHDPLRLFYYKGDIGLLESPCVSIIGTRKATNDGLKRTERLVKLFIDKKFTIVSGLAKGVDTKALQTAINLKGKVIAVIGTPIDEYYPIENKELQDSIAKNHLLISKVPFYRYKTENFSTHKFHFPKRNITMSAISEASIIVEASETSGTHSQARAALKQGKKLFILDSCFQKYKWPFSLEKNGAVRVRKEEDIFEYLQKK